MSGRKGRFLGLSASQEDVVSQWKPVTLVPGKYRTVEVR